MLSNLRGIPNIFYLI
jgi:hypothetical protein